MTTVVDIDDQVHKGGNDLVPYGAVSGQVLQAVAALDRSSSLSRFIAEVNAGMRQMVEELRADEVAVDSVELSQYSFGGTVRRDAGPLLVRDFQPVELASGGNTPLGACIHTILDDLEAGEKRYVEFGNRVKVPWVFGVTDGCPTDEWRSVAARVRDLAARGRLNFFLAYLGNADVSVLQELCPPDQPPLPLDQTKFSDFFKWATMSLAGASRVGAGAGAQPTAATTWVAR